MAQLIPYLFLNGKCREAMDFYKDVFQGELSLMTHKEAQKEACPAGMEDQIMHSMMKKGDVVLMASDASVEAANVGTNVQLTLNCTSREEIETLFKKLSSGGGKVNYALHDTFWGGVFGTITDQYGIHWMLNFDKPK